MKLLKNLALLVCMQIPITFAMEGVAIQEIDAEPAASGGAGITTDTFASMDPLGKAIEEIAEPNVGVILGFIMGSDGQPVPVIKQYTKRDILAGLENINTGTSILIELLKTEQPDISRIVSALSTITGKDVLTLKPHLLQVVWALYNPEPVQMVASNVGTSKDELPRIEELGDEDL